MMKGWVNVYRNYCGELRVSNKLYLSETEALFSRTKKPSAVVYLDTVEITFDENKHKKVEYKWNFNVNQKEK